MIYVIPVGGGNTEDDCEGEGGEDCTGVSHLIAASTVVPSSACFLSSTSLAISCSRLIDSGTTFSPCLLNKSTIDDGSGT